MRCYTKMGTSTYSFPPLNYVIAIITFSVIGLSSPASVEELFEDFVHKYNKSYVRGSSEYSHRLKNFEKSLQRHKALNKLSSHPQDAIYGVTKFSDLTPEEFYEQILGYSHGVNNSEINFKSSILVSLPKGPESFDLRKQKWPVITPVKDQKKCGGCWAFSVTETLETQYALKHKVLYTLSEQQLIDCTVGEGNDGCKGGDIARTARWLNNTKTKITTEKKYPFIDKTDSCHKLKKSDGKVGITDYSHQSFINKESQMADLVASHGPLTVAVDAVSWQDYLGGIIQHHCYAHDDNHAVQIIGYDKTGAVPYFIVRNSWGKNWGLNGYLHIKIGGNLCGIANSVVTVSV